MSLIDCCITISNMVEYPIASMDIPMKHYGLIALFFLLACTHAAAFAQSKTVVGKPVDPLEDKSLTTEEYYRLGMPPVERRWTREDLQKAVAVLTKLKPTPEKLPRFQSPQSGEVFAKLLDREAAKLVMENGQSPPEQIVEINGYLQPIAGALQIYAMAAWPRRSLAVEQVELAEPMLFLVVHVIREANLFQKSLDPSDPTYRTRQQGFDKMRSGMGQVVVGLLVSMGDKVYSQPATRVRLAGILKEYLPAILAELPDTLQRDYRGRIVRLAERETDSQVKDVLDAMLSKIPVK